MSSTEKRKHTTLTLQTKIEIIRKIENGAKINDLAKFYGVGRATIHDIRKNREKIEGYLNGVNVGHRKTMKSAEYPQVEEALYNWYVQEGYNTIIPKQILRQKAKYLYKEIMNKDDFKASSGWLEKFKKRYGVGTKTSPIQDAQTPIDNGSIKSEENSVDFTQKLKGKIEECLLSPDQVYHMQQDDLFWKLQSYKSFLRNMDESRLKILSCVNASGKHKLQLLVTGSCSVENNPQIPVTYKYVYEPVINREIFDDWFRNDFIPQVKRFSGGRKILLTLEDSYHDCNEEELNSIDETIQVMLLPKNTINANVNDVLKTNYKRKFLGNLIDDGDLLNTLNQLSLQDVFDTLVEVWYDIPSDVVTASWRQFWPSTCFNCRENASTCFVDNQISEMTQVIINSTLLNEEDMEAWLSETYEGVVADGQNETRAEVVTHENALAAFNMCIQWAEENGVSFEDVLLLRNIQNQVFMKKMISEQDGGIKEELPDWS